AEPDAAGEPDAPACASDDECPGGQRCNGLHRCAAPCAAGMPRCADLRSRAVCQPDGVTVLATRCPDRAFAQGFCASDRCAIECAPGHFDCDDDPTTGCEAGAACPSILLTGFGGSTGYGPDAQCMHPSDNDSYAGPGAREGDAPVAVDLRPAFPEGLRFFGRTHRRFFLNTNGNITFDGAVGRPEAVAFPVADQAMVAPWWADVDTRGGGQPARNNICFALQPHRLVVTWDRVRAHDRRDDGANSFQLVLSIDPDGCADVDVVFRYARCEWSSTGAPGSVDAQAGFDAGNRRNYVSMPMSRSPAIVDLCRTTNVPGGAPGLFRFQLRSSGCWGNI
ncbi:MAG: hypothetical protein JWM10_3304, partial [Myxococcaceae bacterium]|nr:hypothetical protein [Myxococcaceae bacterium]